MRQHRENIIYKDRSRVIELLLQLENKQIMQNNAETCTITLVTRENLNAMKYSIKLYTNNRHK